MQVEAEFLLHPHLHHNHHLYYSPASRDFPSPSSSSSLDDALLLPLPLPILPSDVLPFPDVDMIADVCDWLTDDSHLSPPLSFGECSDRRPDSSPISYESGYSGGSTAQNPSSLVFPGEAGEFDGRSAVFHLIRAYGEAKASEQEVLARVILMRLRDGSSPAGNPHERMAYHFVMASGDGRWDDHCHLVRGSLENFAEALCAFYQTIPVGKFTHLAANSAILNAIPEDTHVIHIVDFEVEEGIQWPLLIHEMACRGQRFLRLTSTRWGDRQDSDLSRERFRETESRLCKLASSLGVKLTMEEVGTESLVAELRKRSRTGEFLAFNCMVGLPHMRSGSSLAASCAAEFLRAAKDSIDVLGGNTGIIVLGDSMGLEEESSKGYVSFLESKLVQTQTLFEAMEFHFPENLGEARIAMECLFLGPSSASRFGFREWEEISRASEEIAHMGLRPRAMSETQSTEAKQVVGEGESPYWVRAGENEMSLNYLGTRLARVSCWN
ncbi:hypothetical protein MLD38_017414 [Melastoma candidum]|uniref:Uncharacterized protein n=1 Tax=Melastoma candidum TaxID=119954 RepID=A0ACB9QPR1_9MYRT|nr:hypothetical protein MLD38_017414 [Melastoma candidum]